MKNQSSVQCIKTIKNPGVEFLARKFKVEFWLKWFFAPKIMFLNNFSIQLKSNYLVMKWIIWHISLNKSVLMRFMQQEKITNFLYRKQRMNSLSFGIFCEKWCDCSIGNGRIPHTNFRLGWQQKLPALRLLFHFQHPQKMGTCNIN